MLLVLHGAKVNAGDFLIRERGLEILRRLRPHQRLVIHPRWEPVDSEVFDSADAVVLCGGPGLARRFHPRVFAMVEDLDAHPTPVLPVALGWSGTPADYPERFKFSRRSLAALRSIHARIGWSGVRDELSLEIVRRAGVGEVRRTGCFAWYHLPSMGRPLQSAERVRRLAFTPAARRRPGGLREVASLLRRLRRRYPQAERYCVFHRGLRAEFETETPTRECLATAVLARGLGYRVVDASRDLGALEFYGQVDLHVGYRVHAHLCTLSRRRPSLLIAEDGRGRGQAVTLADPHDLRAGADALADAVDAVLDQEERSRWPASERAIEEIERTWPTMRETVEQLPRG
jgi:polysaccharide pyruvyl transferase WcaK-like protein